MGDSSGPAAGLFFAPATRDRHIFEPVSASPEDFLHGIAQTGDFPPAWSDRGGSER
jgi:hypothetical protein